MARRGKRIRQARANVAGKGPLPLERAVDAVKRNATAKFTESVEIAMNLTVDPRHGDQVVRGKAILPNGTGKRVRVAVFASGDKADEARAAGADIVGAEDLMETVSSGKIEFDRCIATPNMMRVVGRLGRILGPRNLMPNPKMGTVTMDVAGAVAKAKSEIYFRTKGAGVVHGGVGSTKFQDNQIIENVNAFVDAVVGARPTGAKGKYVKRIVLSSTMGPGIEVDLASVDVF
ncbi:MAG: 50S ribosomal protein L1 [Rhodobacteraceae bacterium]|nr:50S ribosomal protein L1 [Paracoccaceae bacterium]